MADANLTAAYYLIADDTDRSTFSLEHKASGHTGPGWTDMCHGLAAAQSRIGECPAQHEPEEQQI